MPVAVRLPVEGELPSLGSATEWLNSEPLTPDALRGRVVLVEFGTYTCINWLRTLPHVRTWAEQYRDRGFVVLIAHTPEFAFEKDIANVRRSLDAMRIEFPVAVDSDFGIWRAFGNNYWPALYFIDASGRIRHHHFGEGDYDASRRVIEQLLADAGSPEVAPRTVTVHEEGIEAEADWADLSSPETYVGYDRMENFASPGGPVAHARRAYTTPERLRLNQWAFAGEWTIGGQPAVSNEANGRIQMRFHARDLHLVMGPRTHGTSVDFRVLLDGEPPGDSHGLDIDGDGAGVAGEQRLYQLIRQSTPITDRTFQITFHQAGAEAYVFTFG